MCNINLLYKNLNPEDSNFLEVITYNSFKSNSDGEGYLTENWYRKSKAKIISAREDFGKSNWIAFHERFSTHGSNEKKNIQPIITQDLILMHNGTIHDDDYYHTMKSDSNILARKIESEKRKIGLIPAIERVLSDSWGSKSVLILDRETQELFYYKNSETSFWVSKSDDGKEFFASTSKENCEYSMVFYGYQSPEKVKSNTLFQISDSNFVEVSKITDVNGYYEIYSQDSMFPESGYQWGTKKTKKQGENFSTPKLSKNKKRKSLSIYNDYKDFFDADFCFPKNSKSKSGKRISIGFHNHCKDKRLSKIATDISFYNDTITYHIRKSKIENLMSDILIENSRRKKNKNTGSI